MALFQPTIDTGTQQSVRPAGGEQPSAIVAMAPAISQGISQISSFFSEKNKAEAAAGQSASDNKVLNTFVQSTVSRGQQARGKGANTTAIAVEANKDFLKALEASPHLRDDLIKIRKDAASTGGWGKTLSEGTKQEQEAVKVRGEAFSNGFVTSSMSEEEAAAGVEAYTTIKRTNMVSASIDKQMDMDVKVKTKKQKANLVDFTQGATTNFSHTAQELMVQFESGKITAEEFKTQLDGKMQAINANATALGSEVGQGYIDTQMSTIGKMHADALAAIDNQFGADVLKNKIAMRLGAITSELLEDDELAEVVASSNLLGNSNVALMQKADQVTTRVLKSFATKRENTDADVLTKDGEEEGQAVAFNIVMDRVKGYNADPSSFSTEDVEQLDSMLNNMFKGADLNQLKVRSPKDLQAFAKFMADPNVGKHLVKSGGILPENLEAASKVMKEKYSEVIYQKIRDDVFNASVTIQSYSGDPTGAGNKSLSFPLWDNVTMKNSAGTISMELNKDKVRSLPMKAQEALANRVREFNTKTAKHLNNNIRLGAHLEGSNNYTKFLNDNMASILGVGEDPSKKAAREYVEANKPAPVSSPEDRVAALNAEAKKDGLDLSQYADGDYDDGEGNVVTIKGGKVVGVE